MLLEVVALSWDVGGDLHSRREPYAGHLAQRRVRLLGRHRIHAGAHTPALRGSGETDGLRLLRLRFTALADQLLYGWQSAPVSVVSAHREPDGVLGSDERKSALTTLRGLRRSLVVGRSSHNSTCALPGTRVPGGKSGPEYRPPVPKAHTGALLRWGTPAVRLGDRLRPQTRGVAHRSASPRPGDRPEPPQVRTATSAPRGGWAPPRNAGPWPR